MLLPGERLEHVHGKVRGTGPKAAKLRPAWKEHQ